ncbi:MAG TPA: LLM class F420-dependent oxidoreductase [Dehalococcoidia bacterium]
MKYGVTLSNADITNDPAQIKDFVQAAEGAGFDHVLQAEHVMGGHPDRLRPSERVHTYDQPYHEPFVLLSFIAAVTKTLELVTAILILPQRQTGVVAKQAAELDLLSGGRLRLGVGVGRNWMEYEALNEDFKTRGRRLEEQVQLLRKLWTEELVTFEGRWHHYDRMGLNPMPVQRPIPIWMGSFTQVVEPVIKRIATLADGWFPQFPANDEFRALLERFHGYARAAGRDPSKIGIECGVRIAPNDSPDDWIKAAKAFADLDATHLRVFAVGDFGSSQGRIDAFRRWRETVGPALG